ncbi:MAG: metalloregulator ArsR/SmtB family transcription factor [Deltaproteobacteria bacterium]|nr:metalloregulator ArsR/SmtB family transcription factor [Deltaproteobacteria bacterium]
MKAFIKVMKALSDPNRVKILKLLQQKPMFVREIQGLLGISQSAVSKHLKVLENAGFVTFHKEGTWVRYRLANGTSSPYAASVLGNLRHWLENESEISELQARLPDIRKAGGCTKNHSL